MDELYSPFGVGHHQGEAHRGGEMKLFPVEVERNAPMTLVERLLGVVACLSPIIGILMVGLLCGGCVNTLLTRNPWAHERITTVYQSTKEAAVGSLIVAFPQMMSPTPTQEPWFLYNIFTVPAGLVVFCDVPLEAVVDTVCFPYDVFQ